MNSNANCLTSRTDIFESYEDKRKPINVSAKENGLTFSSAD